MRFKPLNDRILVEPMRDATEETVSGIALPDSSKRRPCRGVVVEAGPKAKSDLGDTILYRPAAGTFYEEEGREYRVMADGDVISIIGSNFV